mmetsp:Transcript_712/g.2267  ORF Transcript_712/g.2267 Transcript_712/m.2267 type:complete len:343 (-) Transcript_712:984-2012(-)
MPAVYVRNRLRAATVWGLEALVRRSEPAYERQAVLRVAARPWDPAPCGAANAVAHPDVGGLWFMRQAVPPAAVAAIRALVEAAVSAPRNRGVHAQVEAAGREVAALLEAASKQPAGSEAFIEAHEQAVEAMRRRDALRAAAAQLPAPPPPKRTPREWEWYEFEPGRWMAPMLAHPADGGIASLAARRRHLSNFEVFGDAPVDEWLCLASLQEGTAAGSAERRGCEWLRWLQRELPRRLPCVGAVDEPLAVFHQLQYLQRGCAISAHVDAPTPPADVVATLSLGTGLHDTVRVGSARVRLRPGDLYAIAGPARWEETHEVHPSTSDRLSLTVRFASQSELQNC